MAVGVLKLPGYKDLSPQGFLVRSLATPVPWRLFLAVFTSLAQSNLGCGSKLKLFHVQLL